jgi:NAD(P)-dependent dehydrogenase (short-subunit alcohol dehydrogenase family)/DNA-binding transcriptional regulator YhcF (GntR family)
MKMHLFASVIVQIGGKNYFLERRLSQGQRLPSTRLLAKSLGVSRLTVTQSYEQLIDEGYLQTIVGSGTFVSTQLPDDLLHSASPPSENKMARLPIKLSHYAAVLTKIDIPNMAGPNTPISFRYGRPAFDQFPIQLWRKLLSSHSRASLDWLDYASDPLGHRPLREAIASQTVAEYGRLDTWVHVAATGVIAPFEKITPQEFERIVQVNLMGQVYGAMVALPHLKREGRGALIHISSMQGRRSLPLQSPYCAAKHGLEGFLETLRVELQHEKLPISVTSILPATINTPYYNKVGTKLGVKPTGIPPYYQPDLVADAILYAAEHPMRDFIVGDVGKVLDLLQKISPSLVDSLLLLIGFAQGTNEPKSEDAPNNIFAPIEGQDRVEGDFSKLAIPSFLDWFDMNPPLKWGTLALAVLGVTAFLGGWRPGSDV